MLELKATSSFRKDLKKLRKSKKNSDKLWDIVDLLLKEEKLPRKYKLHKLSGNWKGFWECHIESDWLLIHYTIEGDLVLVRTGSHSELFG